MNSKSGHPVLGIVIGIIGIAAAVFLGLLGGVGGGVIGGMLGLVAILIGIGARRSGRGMGAIVTGTLAIILAISISIGVTNLFTRAYEHAQTVEEAPLVAKYLDKPHLGLIGLLMNLPKDEASLDEFVDQLRIVVESVD